MTTSLYSDLAWLPEAPADFNSCCRALLASPQQHPDLCELRRLANYRLDENQLFRLAQTANKLRPHFASSAPFDELKLGILANGTADFLAPTIAASALRHGVLASVVRGDYGQVMQDALSPDSPILSAGVQVVLLALDHRWYPLQPCPGDAARADEVVSQCLDQLQLVLNSIKRHTGAVCIVQTLAPPPETIFGNLDRALPGALRNLIKRFNLALAAKIAASEHLLFDVAGLASTVGLSHWHDHTSWNLAKVPFSHTYLPLYGDHVGRLLGALRGKSRRCLILDLDNTVWGGVIGDDGLEGIQIAQGDATGEAHLEVQRTALALRARGVVLAVSSKNTDEVARRPFLEHPEMLLKLSDIAVFQANWQDKATNIRAIAGELSLGLSAMVFLDDNPMERDLVRRMLPEVAVPELPSDPALFARTLLAAGYFEAIRLSAEDTTRAEFYEQNSRRAELQKQAGSLDDYLHSLGMVITFQPFDETGRARIAQLISKSNQFNLTTRRYTEAEVAAIEADPAVLHLQIRLKDNFGDNGMISVILCKPLDHETLEIDTWLMSCRVLGRRVEEAVLYEILCYAKEKHFKRLIGRYIPTERNTLVEHHYQKLGFTQLEALGSGETLWELAVGAVAPPSLPMSVVRL